MGTEEFMAETSTIGAGIENVLIQSGACALTILPHLGGKIASLRVNGRELLQAPLAALAPRNSSMSFEDSDASGWDECLPSVAGCSVETANGSAHIPDHGDLWRVAWQPGPADESNSDGTADHITLRANCFSLPLTLERSIALKAMESGNGWKLRLRYTLTNTSDAPVPWSWAGHILFASEAGDRIELPSTVESLRVEGSAGNRLGTRGDRVNWPLAKTADGSEADLSFAEPPGSAIGDKLFTGPLNRDDGWCALERPSAGVRIRVRFDPAATPYIGLWLCYGGWPDRPGPKQSCVALEPSTAPVDSLAQTGVWSRLLGAGESCTWPMQIEIEQL
jgi:galactose mutarotase-like enzyme